MVARPSFHALTQALGLFLGGLVAVGGAIVGLALGPSAWALSVSVVALAIWHLWQSTPRPHRYWQWLALVPGCAFGMVAGLLLALQVSSQERNEHSPPKLTLWTGFLTLHRPKGWTR